MRLRLVKPLEQPAPGREASLAWARGVRARLFGRRLLVVEHDGRVVPPERRASEPGAIEEPR